MTKNILYICDTGMIRGGGEISLLTLLENLDRKIFKPVVCLPEEGDLCGRIRSLGIEPLFFKYRRLLNPFNTTNTLNTIGFFSGIIRKESIDLVHANCSGGLIYMAGEASLRTSVPLISHARTLEAGWLSDFFQSRLSARIIAASSAVAEQFSRFGASGRVSIVPNAVDAAAYRRQQQARQAMRSQLGCSEKDHLIGNISSYQPGKGLGHFIKAAQAVYRSIPDARFLVAGFRINTCRYYRKHLEKESARAGLKGRIEFLTDRRDIPDILAALDVFAFSTLKEGFGRAVIEAMAGGLPVVAFASGGVKDIIQDGVTGILVKPADHSALADGIIRVLADKDLASRLGNNASIQAEERFSIKAHVSKIQNIYEQVLADKK